MSELNKKKLEAEVENMLKTHLEKNCNKHLTEPIDFQKFSEDYPDLYELLMEVAEDKNE